MLTPYIAPNIPNFVGRVSELRVLRELSKQKKEAKIITVYGRRRVGKTELIQHAYGKRNLLKFEGIEDGDEALQRKVFLSMLAKYTNNHALNYSITENWIQVFDLLTPYVEKGEVTLFFEELQWMANYKTELISAIKHAWDNHFKKNPELILVLCGSSPSFIIKEVVRSKALYNRSNYEIPLLQFTLDETKQFLNKEKINSFVMDAYLSVGGIPEYLKKIKEESSVYLGLLKNSFYKESPFKFEYEKIFVSSFKDNPNYKKTVEFLAERRFASRPEILKFLNKASGSNITNVIEDLELCQFINCYKPFNNPESELLDRFEISDSFLQFYIRFIKKQLKLIEQNQFQISPERALPINQWKQFLGYSFERFCKYNSECIAKILGFNGVQYEVGSFYNKTTKAKDPNFQIDLIFSRADKVITVCDIKYKDERYDIEDANKFLKSLEQLPKTSQGHIQRVLITQSDPTEVVISKSIFNRVIKVEELF